MGELRRVVLVEDDPDIAILARLGLEDFGGLSVVHHSSGQAALDNASSDAPDLIILDYRMPGMNGADVLRELRCRSETQAIPVVFMTASVMPRHIERLRELGALDVIPKPFDPLTLADRVREIWSTNVSQR
jgi:CheY-like chemotaxis protein